MSSKIVGRGAVPVAPLAWKRTAEGELAPASASEAGVEAERKSLRDHVQALAARLQETTRESASREQRAAEAGREQGYKAGFADGAARAASEGEAALEQIRRETTDRLARAAAESLELRRRMREQLEQDLVRLAVAIARRILRRELTVDPAALGGIVRAAVEKVVPRELHRIRVAARDLAVARACDAFGRLPERVEIVADASLEPGALILETARGQLDASVETQLDEIDRGLTDLIGPTPGAAPERGEPAA